MCVYTHAHTHARTYIHLQEYYSAIKKNEIMPSEATWMDLEIIIKSEKDKYHMVSLTVQSKK